MRYAVNSSSLLVPGIRASQATLYNNVLIEKHESTAQHSLLSSGNKKVLKNKLQGTGMLAKHVNKAKGDTDGKRLAVQQQKIVKG